MCHRNSQPRVANHKGRATPRHVVHGRKQLQLGSQFQGETRTISRSIKRAGSQKSPQAPKCFFQIQVVCFFTERLYRARFMLNTKLRSHASRVTLCERCAPLGRCGREHSSKSDGWWWKSPCQRAQKDESGLFTEFSTTNFNLNLLESVWTRFLKGHLVKWSWETGHFNSLGKLQQTFRDKLKNFFNDFKKMFGLKSCPLF